MTADEKRQRTNAYHREYAKQNRQKIRAINNRHRNKFRERYRAKSKQWRDLFPERQQHSHLKTNYGITLNSYNEMIQRQNGLCIVCGSASSFKKLHVDHDHTTGKIRGLLCQKCNMAIGCTNDDPRLLRLLADYLEEYQ